jgi:hypothetical protein
VKTKPCRRCGEEKPLIKFDKTSKPHYGDGRRQTCRSCTLAGASYGRVPKSKPKRFTRSLDARRYIVTSAQNATAIDAPFFEALRVAAKHLNAELVVVPFRYKNPTSIWSQRQQSDEWWDPAVVPYLFNTRKKLNDNLVLCGDVKIQPTASAPLQGFEALTGAESCIFGHPKMAFESIPAPTGRFPKILSTTGAVTKKNYTDTKAGKLGAFHHFLGAVVVEIEGKQFHLRQVNADREDGSFIDLDLKFSPKGVEPAPPALALVCGDTHARFTDPVVDEATFGPGGIVETLNPRTVAFHDLFDGYSVNHHHGANPFIRAAKAKGKIGDVRAEVGHAVAFVAERTRGRRAVIVPSNHDNFLNRWILATDWRFAGGNAKFLLVTAAAMLDSVEITPQGAKYADAFKWWVDRLKGDAKITALEADQSFKVAGIECGMHGDHGPNGARATLSNLARIGAKSITGHAHSPAIREGHYRVGTSSPLKLEYTRGPSSWLNTHCVVYANGKRSLITIVDGKWRLGGER